MMNAVVLDTVVASVISPFKKDSSQKRAYQNALVGRSIVLSAQTVAELYSWALRTQWGTQWRERFERFIENFTVAPCDLELAPVWASVRFKSMQIGRELAVADAWIAPTAIHYGLELVTRDKDLVGLAIPELKVTLYA